MKNKKVRIFGVNIPTHQGRGHTRINEAERAALVALAELEGVNLSEVVRMALREAAKARGLWPPKQPEAIHEQAA